MAALQWDTTGNRFFELGVDHAKATSATGIGNRTFADRITSIGAQATVTTFDNNNLLDIRF